MSDAVSDQLAARRGDGVGSTATTAQASHGAVLWAQAIGQFDHATAYGVPAYHAATGGAMAGVDYPVAPGAVLGVAAGGATVHTTDATGATADNTLAQFVVYGGLRSGMVFADAQVSGVYGDQTVRRPTSLLLAVTAHSSEPMVGAGGKIEGGIHLDAGKLFVEPTVGVSVVDLSSSAVTESGSGPLGLRVSGATLTSAQSFLGARIGTEMHVTDATALGLHALLGWAHEFGNDVANTQAAFEIGGAPLFTVASPTLGRDMARIGAGFDLGLSPQASLYGSYQAQIGRNNDAQYVTGGVRFIW
jgi:outer membrane autotransporter protein